MHSLRYLLIPFCMMMVACSGGSGAGSGSNSGSSAPSINTGAITEANGDDVIELTLLTSESLLKVSQAIVNATNAYLANGSAMLSENCANGGSFTVDVDDPDNSDSLTAGDTVLINYAQCFDDAINEDVLGSVSIEIKEVAPVGPSLQALTGRVTFADGFLISTSDGEAPVSGSYLLQYSPTQIVAETEGEETITIALAVLGGAEETYRNFEVQQSLFFSTEYEVELEIGVDSEFFNTRYDCSGDALTGEVNTAPTAGSLTCTAEDGSSTRATAATSLLEIDSDGDLNYEFSTETNVFALIEGYLFGNGPQ